SAALEPHAPSTTPLPPPPALSLWTPPSIGGPGGRGPGGAGAGGRAERRRQHRMLVSPLLLQRGQILPRPWLLECHAPGSALVSGRSMPNPFQRIFLRVGTDLNPCVGGLRSLRVHRIRRGGFPP